MQGAEAAVVDSPPGTLEPPGGKGGPWLAPPEQPDPINNILARGRYRELPSELTGVGRRGALPLHRRENRGEGRHRIPVPIPGASITREVPQHRPVGPEAQDLLHRQVDHGVVAPLRLHLPRRAPAALSSGTGRRRRRLRGYGGGGVCAAPPGRRRRGRLRGSGLGAAAAADGPPEGGRSARLPGSPRPAGETLRTADGGGEGAGRSPGAASERGLGAVEAAVAPSQGQHGAAGASLVKRPRSRREARGDGQSAGAAPDGAPLITTRAREDPGLREDCGGGGGGRGGTCRQPAHPPTADTRGTAPSTRGRQRAARARAHGPSLPPPSLGPLRMLTLPLPLPRPVALRQPAGFRALLLPLLLPVLARELAWLLVPSVGPQWGGGKLGLRH